MSTGQEKSIFLDAIEIDSDLDRNEFLREACGDDLELLASVEALLREHFREEQPVDRYAFANLASTLGFPRQEAFSLPYSPGMGVGPYKLREQIGEGGFGLVFVADQETPLRRRVALKIIKPGMDSPEVIARFEAERQALALMDHANIARVYDAGMTQSGHPYFVMELVRGVPLNDYCDRHKLTTTERLELFVSICYAVQYAHQKGVIHRDLKPSNILVSLENGRPVPKIIDFGVAKAINQSLTDRTIYTRYASMIGTPAYMSPEQAEMSNLDIDTRSDIYSLGVLLYEMLTGSTPLVQDRVARVGFDELRRIIREEEAQRPSYRLSTLSNEIASTVSANRQLEPSRLSSTVKGDLDWIVMKALDKDRNRRYATAAAFAEDVDRYLSQQPIEARPPSSIYRFSKYASRHKIFILTTSIVTASLVLGLIMSAWQASVATLALRDARIAETEAKKAKEDLQQFTEHLKQANSLLTSGYSHVDAGNWSEAHEAYERATEVQPRYFPVWIGRGSLYAKLGLWELAAADYERAMELGSPLDRVEYLGVPQLFLYTDRISAYENLRSQLANSAEISGGAVSRGILVDDDVSPEEAKKIADVSEEHLSARREDRDEYESHPRRERSGMPHGVRLYVAGWAHLKTGNLDQAVQRLQQSNEDRKTWSGHGISYPLLAIAYQEMGKTSEAQEALRQSRQQLDSWLEESLNGPDAALPIPWFDWIEFMINHQRAEKLINGAILESNAKLVQRNSRAMSAIQYRDNSKTSP